MTKIESEQNKKIFAKNFNYYLVKNGKTQTDIVKALGLTAVLYRAEKRRAKRYEMVRQRGRRPARSP